MARVPFWFVCFVALASALAPSFAEAAKPSPQQPTQPSRSTVAHQIHSLPQRPLPPPYTPLLRGRPSPPGSPPRPRSATATARVCVYVLLYQLLDDGSPTEHTISDATCTRLQEQMASDMNSKLIEMGLLLSAFTVNPSLCDRQRVSTCGQFYIPFQPGDGEHYDLIVYSRRRASAWVDELQQRECHDTQEEAHVYVGAGNDGDFVFGFKEPVGCHPLPLPSPLRPPLRPPSPSSPLQVVHTCIFLHMYDLIDYDSTSKHSISNATCARLQKQMASDMNSKLAEMGLLVSNFTADAALCENLRVLTCGRFYTPGYEGPAYEALLSYAWPQARRWVSALTSMECGDVPEEDQMMVGVDNDGGFSFGFDEPAQCYGS